ncbi:hypothetical protein TrispH2_012139, partial [Trichoplax sp. H2]
MTMLTPNNIGQKHRLISMREKSVVWKKNVRKKDVHWLTAISRVEGSRRRGKLSRESALQATVQNSLSPYRSRNCLYSGQYYKQDINRQGKKENESRQSRLWGREKVEDNMDNK